MVYAPRANEPELIAARAAVPADHVQGCLLYAGRIIATGGWLVLTYTFSGGNRATNAEHAFLGLVLLLLGVFLIMLALMASQFPGVAGAAAAAIADIMLFYGPVRQD